MNRFALAVVATFTTAATAHAGGLDRSGQGIDALFEEGNYAEVTFGFVDPSVDGTDDMAGFLSSGGPAANPSFGSDTGNVADSFLTVGAAFKYQFSEAVSFALIVDEPYGSDISYPESGNTVASLVVPGVQVEGSALGGTEAVVDSYAVTALGRYEFGNGFSMHGGLRYQEISANVTLSGLAYGGLNGYNAGFSSDGAFGYVVGGAYERPDIALRIALTYNSKIDHELSTKESVSGIPVSVLSGGALGETSTTDITAPESLNLEFQTGVARDTLVFGSIRYARYEDTIVSPVFFDQQVEAISGTTNNSLTDIENSTDFEIGVGRRFTDKFSGSIAFGYSSSGDDDLVSPLAPTNGSRSIAVGGSYQVTDAVKLTGGVRYTDLRDARPETGTPDTARADFDGNDAIAVGLKIGYSF
ncbi:hypothetical protein MWU52_05065 [Jannaschia sp. S6380]|uniref:OmpP1/FadL family transporter n=1 Tax=Jannaschia sp. S6380 TaxID=2926408 RepID=UPI001FF168ED|nr:hypothetical protein [Jannaschia sp. S6380]MCK0166917.1 hypothetical protein [Jannaschia sp. S6380]